MRVMVQQTEKREKDTATRSLDCEVGFIANIYPQQERPKATAIAQRVSIA